jgi:hypothetical protein
VGSGGIVSAVLRQAICKLATSCCRARRAVAFATLVTLQYVAATPATEAFAAKAKARQVRIEYVPPTNLAHQSIYEQLRKAQALEYVQELFNAFRLPRPLTFKLTGCDGVVNAWYGDDEVIVCYEFLAEILKNAPEKEAPADITRQDAIIGSMLDVFLHEAGHAVFDLLKIPLFGREEDAADQFSTYIMLQYDKNRARRLILGSAYQYKVDMQQPELSIALKKFSDEHGFPAQRFYNILCVAYGADPKLFADVVERNYLPQNRAEGCEEEYRQVSFAFKTLIGPYVYRQRAKRALKRRLKSPNDLR